MTTEISQCRQDLWDINTGNRPEALVESVLQLFGIADKMDTKPARENERGHFFIYQRPSAAAKGTLTKLPLEEALPPTSVVLFTGIDTGIHNDDAQGRSACEKYLTNYASNISGTLVNAEEPVLTYQYKTTPGERINDVKELYKSEEYASYEAREVANKLFDSKFRGDAPPDQTVIISHSFGGLFQKMVMNHMSGRALEAYHGDRDKARQFMSRFTNISIGIKPSWHNSKEEKKSKYLDIQRDSIELYVIAPDDSLSYPPRYVLQLYNELVTTANPDKSVPSYFLFGHEGDPAPKFLALLTPGNIPAAVNIGNYALRNLGGHGLIHYIEALGFTAARDSKENKSNDLNYLRNLVDMAIHDPDQFRTTELTMHNRADIRDAAHGFERPDEEQQNRMKKIQAKQIGNEAMVWADQELLHPMADRKKGR